MKIEIGNNYKDGRGRVVTIMGPTKHYPEYYYSLQGDWYDAATGQFVMTSRDGTRELLSGSMYNIVELIGPHGIS